MFQVPSAELELRLFDPQQQPCWTIFKKPVQSCQITAQLSEGWFQSLKFDCLLSAVRWFMDFKAFYVEPKPSKTIERQLLNADTFNGQCRKKCQPKKIPTLELDFKKSFLLMIIASNQW